MINIVISKINNSLVCHTVGLNQCLSIKEKQHKSDTEFETYSYEAVYPDRVEQIPNVILASDQKLV